MVTPLPETVLEEQDNISPEIEKGSHLRIRMTWVPTLPVSRIGIHYSAQKNMVRIQINEQDLHLVLPPKVARHLHKVLGTILSRIPTDLASQERSDGHTG